MDDFYKGMLMGTLSMLILVSSFVFVKFVKENSGWDNKMVIEYRSLKKFDHDLVRDLVNKSEIVTNFINREITMGEHYIKYVLTNPETKK